MSKFLKNLFEGKTTEEYVANTIASMVEECSIGDGKLVDLYIHRNPLPKIKCEVKHDVMSDRTGNIAIEFFNSKTNKASGLMATQCDIWFHVLGSSKEIWFTSVSKLKDFCNSTKPFKIIYSGGDKNSDMMIFKKEVLSEVFFKLSDTKDLMKTIGELLC